MLQRQAKDVIVVQKTKYMDKKINCKTYSFKIRIRGFVDLCFGNTIVARCGLLGESAVLRALFPSYFESNKRKKKRFNEIYSLLA